MSIQYVLHPNKLNGDPGAYVARVRPAGRIDMEALVEQMLKRGSTVTRPDILSALEDFFGAIEDMLAMGFNVGTPLADFRLSIKGVFAGDEDSFDPDRHQVAVCLKSGPRLRQLEPARWGVAKQPTATNAPRPRTFSDVASGSSNDQLTPGSIAKLTGYYLQYDPADPEQGIFFQAGDGSESRVEVISENGPRKLHFLLPALSPGQTTVDVAKCRVVSK